MSEYQAVRVTSDPELEAKLRERIDDLSSQDLAAYAHELGLYPPGYGPNFNPPIGLFYPPDMADDDDGIISWDLDSSELPKCCLRIGTGSKYRKSVQLVGSLSVFVS